MQRAQEGYGKVVDSEREDHGGREAFLDLTLVCSRHQLVWKDSKVVGEN